MSRRWRRALHHPGFAVGLALTVAIVGTAVCALVYTPRDPLRMELAARLEGPSATHPMGTDQYGRDLSPGSCAEPSPRSPSGRWRSRSG